MKAGSGPFLTWASIYGMVEYHVESSQTEVMVKLFFLDISGFRLAVEFDGSQTWKSTAKRKPEKVICQRTISCWTLSSLIVIR